MQTSIDNDKEKAKGLSETKMANIESIENEIESSNQYLKPKPDRIYMIQLDLTKNKIMPVTNDRFKDAKGNPIKR